MFVGNDVNTLVTTFFGNFYMVKPIFRRSIRAAFIFKFVSIHLVKSLILSYCFVFLYKNSRNRFMIFSKVFHTFITFVSYIINCRKHQVFLNLIFFFFIRGGTKVPASFPFIRSFFIYPFIIKIWNKAFFCCITFLKESITYSQFQRSI